MKKLFIAGILLMAMAVGIVFGASTAIATMNENGYAVPAENNIKNDLKNGEKSKVLFTEVDYEDTVYSSLAGYFIGTRRNAVDNEFPIYVNNLSTLRFLNEENYLISKEMELYKTFEGLYLADGITYNIDKSQADYDEFILLSLTNGLYMTAQRASFKNLTNTRHDIPFGSILYLNETVIRWYYPTGSGLVYMEEEAVIGATITFGDTTYSYAKLLKALGLLKEAVQDIDSDSKNEADRKQDSARNIVDPITGDSREESGTAEGDESRSEESVTENSGSGNKPEDSAGQGGKGDSILEGESTDAGKNDSSGHATGGENSEITDESMKDADNSDTQGESVKDESGESDEESGKGDDESKLEESTSQQIQDSTEDGDPTEVSEQIKDDNSNIQGASYNDSEEISGEAESAIGGGEGDDSEGENFESVPVDESRARRKKESAPEFEDSEENNSAGTGTGEDPKFYMPEVNLTNFQTWCYAIAGELSIWDDSAVILRGVNITVYRSLKSGHAASSYVGPGGLTYYPATTADGKTAYEGASAVIRKTYRSDSTAILSPIQPGLTVYVQVSYRYNMEIQVWDAELGEYKKGTTRVNYLSDLVKITLPTVEEATINPVEVDWVEAFASQDTGFEFNNVTMKNVSDYDSRIGNTTFANFIKDTTPYVNRITLTMVPTSGKTVTSAIGAGVLEKAYKNEGGTQHKTGKGVLKSNMKYTYTMVATDRYGNVIPLQIGEHITGEVYTSKLVPSVKTTEIENITDLITLQAKVNDPDGALIDNGNLTVKAREVSGTYAALAGYFPDETKFSCTTEKPLVLKNHKDGDAVVYTLNSLAFSKVYYIEVYGSYQVQPTQGDGIHELKAKTNELLGTTKVFTAPLTNGNLYFETAIEDLLDTTAVVSFRMTTDSTLDVLKYLDAYEFIITKEGAKSPLYTYQLSYEDLNTKDYEYDSDLQEVVLVPADEAAGTPKVSLKGTATQFSGKSLWDAIMVESIDLDDGSGDVILKTGVRFAFTFPTDSLETFTKYKLDLRSLVFKSGVTYQIPTSITMYEFTTKKIQPKILRDDFLVAGTSVSFLNLRIYDPDTVIQKNGLVHIYLYYGDTLIGYNSIYATTNKDQVNNEPMTFTDIIPGADYTIVFEADAFNDADGYDSYRNKQDLNPTFSFKGSELLNADLTLEELTYSVTKKTKTEFVNLTAAEVQDGITKTDNKTYTTADKTWGVYSKSYPDVRFTPWFPIPEGATFVTIDDFYMESYKWSGSIYLYFAKTATGGSATGAYTSSMTYGASEHAFYVPSSEYKYVRMIINIDTCLRDGLRMSYLTTDQSCDIMKTEEATNRIVEKKSVQTSTGAGYKYMEAMKDNASYDCLWQYPVTPGEQYFMAGCSNTSLYFYNSDHGYVCTAYGTNYNVFTIPEGVYYLSYDIVRSSRANHKIFRICEAPTTKLNAEDVSDDTFYAKVKVQINDLGPYLTDDIPLTLTIEKSQTVNVPSYSVYTDEYSEYDTITLTKSSLKEDYWYYDAFRELKSLEAGTKYRLTVSVMYRGSKVTLDTLEFDTAQTYTLIKNCRQIVNLATNRLGNYLVVNDIDQNMSVSINFWGKIDFQGHTVTRHYNGGLFSTIMPGAEVRNVVYLIPEETASTSYGLMQYNFGLIENVMVKTLGAVTTKYAFVAYQNNGTIRNVILELGGDLTIYRQNAYTDAALVGQTFYGGTTSNVYGYGLNGAGILHWNPTLASGWYSGGLLGRIGYDSVAEHVFTTLNSWYTSERGTNSDMTSILSGYLDAGVFKNSYAVGEYYMLTGSGAKSYALFSANDRTIGNSAGVTNCFNIYNFSTHTYKATSGITNGDIALLQSADWQESILGDAFNYTPVERGFYPQLKLPVCMQKYQKYLPLPSVSGDNVPSPVDDEMTPGRESVQENSKGFINIYFRNTSGYRISALYFDHLVVKEIVGQGVRDDGLYYVTARVEASGYPVHYKLVKFEYIVGSSTLTQPSSYSTSGIRFWKEVGGVEDWRNINKNMSWCYKLTTDIDCKDELDGSMLIGGSNKTQTFTGIIDGDGFAFKNYKARNILQSYLFYYIYTSNYESGLYNITFDNMTLTGIATSTYAGIVRYANRSYFDNVHVRNSTITGSQYVGGLVGFVENSTFDNCSVTETNIGDVKSSNSVMIGGFAGRLYYYSQVKNCYVRNTNIVVDESSLVSGVGGFVGYTYLVTYTDCYATGKIAAEGTYVGGFAGYTTTSDAFFSVFTDVDLNVIGDKAGGVVGGMMYQGNCLAMGDIICDGVNAHRISGMLYHTSYDLGYAFANQIVNALDEGAVDGARALLTGSQLATKTAWVDVMHFSENWDYSPLTRGKAPKLYDNHRVDENGNRLLVEGQEKDVKLPGQGGEARLKVNGGDYDPNSKRYICSAEFTHPGMTPAEAKQLFEGGGISISIAGMVLDPASILSGVAIVNFDALSADTSSLTLSTTTYIMAKDTYTLTISYTFNEEEYLLQGVVDYGRTLYWEIPDLETWNQMMETHGYNSENFKITGMIDFLNTTPTYTSLKLGRLSGEDPSYCGFQNMQYVPNATGDSWIEAVNVIIENLTFVNIDANFSVGISTNRPSGTGMILKCYESYNIHLRDCDYKVNNYTDEYFGFFSRILTKADTGTIENCTITRPSNFSGSGSYMGILVANAYDAVKNYTVNNCKVEAKAEYYATLVVGYVTNTNSAGIHSENITVTNSSVSGYAYVYGICGYSIAMYFDNCTVDNCDITAVTHAGGMYGWYSRGYYDTVTNCIIKSTYTGSSTGIYTGGLTYQLYDGVRYALVKNCVIIGPGYVGGLGGAGYYTNYLNTVEACYIESTSLNPAYCGAGGLVGGLMNTSNLYYSTVRGGDPFTLTRYDDEGQPVVTEYTPQIKSKTNAGGAVGYSNLSSNISRCYIAEDVVVTATEGCAGGMIGYSCYDNLYDCAVGATVTGTEAVGGFVGHYEPPTDSEKILTIATSFFKGKLTATKDYCGGIVGKWNHSSLQTTNTTMNGVIVAAEISCPGNNVSFWVNNTSAYDNEGDGKIFIWTGSTINGETPSSLALVAQATETKTNVYPESGGLLTTAAFNNKQTYLDAGWTTTNWYFDHLGQKQEVGGQMVDINYYMPFVRYNNSANAQSDAAHGWVLYLTRYKKVKYMEPVLDENDLPVLDDNNQPVMQEVWREEPVGILLPVDVVNLDPEIVAYAASVNTLGLHVDLPAGTSNMTLTIAFEEGGVPKSFDITTNANGDATCYYNFQSDFTVNGIEYQASKLLRNVMQVDDYWYYIDYTDGNKVKYGDKYGYMGVLTTAEEEEITDVVHIWQGMLLKNNGDLMVVSVGKVQAVAGAFRGVLNSSALTASYFSKKITLTVTISSTLECFYNRSTYNGKTYGSRIYYNGKSFKSLESGRNFVYDAVIYTSKQAIAGTTTYFAALGSDGVIHNFGANLKADGFTNEGIAQMSNNMKSEVAMLIVRYQDGTVAVLDYTRNSDNVVYTTRVEEPENTDLGGYFGKALKNIFDGLNIFGSKTPTTTDIVCELPGVNKETGEVETVVSDSTAKDVVITTNGEGVPTLTQDVVEYKYVPGEGLVVGGETLEIEGEYEYIPEVGVMVNGKLEYVVNDLVPAVNNGPEVSGDIPQEGEEEEKKESVSLLTAKDYQKLKTVVENQTVDTVLSGTQLVTKTKIDSLSSTNTEMLSDVAKALAKEVKKLEEEKAKEEAKAKANAEQFTAFKFLGITIREEDKVGFGLIAGAGCLVVIFLVAAAIVLTKRKKKVQK